MKLHCRLLNAQSLAWALRLCCALPRRTWFNLCSYWVYTWVAKLEAGNLNLDLDHMAWAVVTCRDRHTNFCCTDKGKGQLEQAMKARRGVEVESSWNVMAHGDAREGKWRGTWRMEWVASTLHTTSEHGVSNITTADAHPAAAISRLNWRPRLFKWTCPFSRKTKSGFCACAITFQMQSIALLFL